VTARSPDRLATCGLQDEVAQLAGLAGFRSSERYLAQGDLDPGFFPLPLAIDLSAVDANPRSGSCAATYVEILAGGADRPLGRRSERP